jgi:membrane protein DedA with SNARE-associated domain
MMEATAVEWLSRYGVTTIFILLALGMFGLPMVTETLLIVAGALVRSGELAWLPALTAAVLGSAVGMTTSYAIGRSAGQRLVQRCGSVMHVKEIQLAHAKEWFRRVGKWSLMLGYFVPGSRHLAALVAGSARLDFWVFAAFAYSGAAVWAAVLLSSGFALGDRWQPVTVAADRHLTMASCVVAIAAAAAYAVRHHHQRQGRLSGPVSRRRPWAEIQ